jgi:hypothetical protein
VTPDARRLSTAIRTAMIPTPTRISTQSDIVCSLLEFEHHAYRGAPDEAVRDAGPRMRIRSSCPDKGQGMGRSSRRVRTSEIALFAEDLRDA